jgi:hypothetical protein
VGKDVSCRTGALTPGGRYFVPCTPSGGAPDGRKRTSVPTNGRTDTKSKTPRSGAGPALGRLGLVLCLLVPAAHAAEHVVLANGFELDCVRQEAVAGERVRLYTGADSYMEVAASAIRRVEVVADAPVAPAAPKVAVAEKGEDLKGLLADAGARHRIDVDLLAAVVKQESGGQVAAVSRAGAAGLMQLMPGTAAQLGVKDRFKAKDNVDGGTAYLDALLTRYHDDVVKALAAYNAGPGAVDRWGGVPPYKETRAYVARIIAEFNRRKRMEMAGR